MEIKSETREDIVWLKLSGRMVFDKSLLRLREQVLSALESGKRRFVIDIAEVSYLDSMGCGEAISIHTSIKRATGSLVFVNPPDHVRRLWAHTKLDTVLNIRDTPDAAREFFKR